MTEGSCKWCGAKTDWPSGVCYVCAGVKTDIVVTSGIDTEGNPIKGKSFGEVIGEELKRFGVIGDNVMGNPPEKTMTKHNGKAKKVT